LTAAGLPVPSIVRSAKIATIEASEAIRIGCLAVSDRSAVRDQLADMLEPALVRPS
jgi:mRNA interferase MazF